MNVGIIIVNWNGKKHTIECLDSLRKIHRNVHSLHVYVVDNASSDDSVSVIQAKYPEVTVIRNATNLGFSGGNNIGIRRAMNEHADFIWLLNNDTRVDPEAMCELISVGSKSGVGIVGPKIYFEKGYEFHYKRYKNIERGNVLWYAGGVIDWKNMYASHRGVDEVDVGQYDKLMETPFVTGCSMFIKKEVIETIGFLDERYFLYLEDLDYSLRAHRAGYKIIYAPKAIVWHKNAGSTSKPGNTLHQYYFTRNRLLLGFSYASTKTKFALLKEGLRFIVSGTEVQKKAVFDFLLRRFGNRYIWK